MGSEIGGVARDQRQIVTQGGCRQESINYSDGLLPGCRAAGDSSPTIGDGILDRQNAFPETKSKVGI